ncbi:RNA polymerase subunit sigma-70 [Bacillus carboniphilus]|uniref:RNA polymerase subunit sigma-70 n=1 Tax=Bacillus carboniphilus TaxID=86663 RepID=A0ABY9JXD4_9BACI|nr:RNA polymerase subunit sigma-70 [Bacillus carboniphilus]WLR44046.1 RNA polymerase subunit sigma-70 [Bacillus carboniphilus]
MRSNEKSSQTYEKKDVFGVNFHDFIVLESQATTYEIASEFGLSLRDVKNLQKKIKRS